jgi:flagellar biogenesis protein FliO
MQKLAIGFGIGALLIACTWAARAALDSNGKPSAPAAPTAQETNAEPALPEEELPAEKMGLVEETTSPVQVLVSLLIVVAVMVTLLWGLSRLMRRARLTPSRDRVLDLVDALSLGGKRQVYVVAYKDRTLVLGCGNEDIHLLAEYAADEFERADSESVPSRIDHQELESREDREDTIEISSAARARQTPAGAHRVPAAFRHLLADSMDSSGNSNT